jgi:hypothetical protein
VPLPIGAAEVDIVEEQQFPVPFTLLTDDDTRRALIGRIHEEGAFLFPAHFSDPHYGSLGLDGDEFTFRPGGASGTLSSTQG